MKLHSFPQGIVCSVEAKRSRLLTLNGAVAWPNENQFSLRSTEVIIMLVSFLANQKSRLVWEAEKAK